MTVLICFHIKDTVVIILIRPVLDRSPNSTNNISSSFIHANTAYKQYKWTVCECFCFCPPITLGAVEPAAPRWCCTHIELVHTLCWGVFPSVLHVAFIFILRRLSLILIQHHIMLYYKILYHISTLYLVHISAVGAISLHAIRTWSTLYSLGGYHTLHPRVAGVGFTGWTRVQPTHPWGKSVHLMKCI